ncbi:Metallo-beta-lactamase superfamily protein [Favolaschia claudopus]|uniref:Metallo-beta-lactamase superfamily protein n=1 Tax=Favolaschia claudopus TaxID=2862362 RepID=A0AAW0BEH1_9AGAR
MASLSLLAVLALGFPRAVIGFGHPPVVNSTVDVKVFNVANITTTVPGVLLQPVLPGYDTIHMPDHAFLIEHGTERIMFDLGMRSDPLNFPPSVASFFESGVYSVDSFKDITELLTEGGIALESIDTIIWSHSHFDHIGNMAKWPNSTNLVVGPGTNRSLYPEYPDSALQASDFAGHTVTELSFENTNLTISGLPAIDYFGDQSFYLLNTPGHLMGHISALARVTPSTFVVLGADTCHHAGQLRPRPRFQTTYACPAELVAQAKNSVSTDYFWSPDSQPHAFDILSRAQPLLSIPDPPNSADANPVAGRVSLDQIAGFDADENYFVVLAHDLSLTGRLPYFPESLSPWKAKKLKEDVVWAFLEAENPAFRFG